MHKKEERGGDERRVDSAVNISLTFSFWFPVREHHRRSFMHGAEVKVGISKAKQIEYFHG